MQDYPSYCADGLYSSGMISLKCLSRLKYLMTTSQSLLASLKVSELRLLGNVSIRAQITL